jgi:5-methylcytosine-specific restriction protein A
MDKVNIGNQVDHIQPAEDNPELFWNPENLQVLCRKCHAIKTRRGE